MIKICIRQKFNTKLGDPVKITAIFSVLVLLFVSCQSKQPAEDALFEVMDSTYTHIGFVNQVQETNQLNILEYLYFYNGGGVAAGDINNDGLVDLFFVSNQGKNKLYLNKGDSGSGVQFEDISALAGIEGFSDWQTGVTMADVNGDGWLDIYVCAVSNYKGLEGSNELYINNGNSPNGNSPNGPPTFNEKAADYGLDFSGFSTQAAFFDFDHDGDLDMYLLNHAIHTSRSYNRVSTRSLRNNEAGDYLFENQLMNADGSTGKVTKFKNISGKAGIYQAAMGYGLGIAIADLNNDGWEDMYVSNDFHEDDYYYINNSGALNGDSLNRDSLNGDFTFTESMKSHFRHLSRFSMGNDVADINNDGFLDVMTLDMYPEDEKIEKSSVGEDPLDIFLYKLQFGYFHQYSRNCLQLSLSGEKFTDIGAMAGVAATDWSWSTLIADYNNDGIKDIFITNGIVRRPNNLDYIKYATSDSLGMIVKTSGSLDNKLISLMPEGKVHNYFFKGTTSLRFEDKSVDWGFSKPTISNGATYADIDNDGDLDLITNNLNEPAGIYLNRSDKILKHHFLKIKLQGEKLNTFGIGAKVILKQHGEIQMQQLMPTRGFMSSVEPLLNFGLGQYTNIDTLMVIWPNQRISLIANVHADETLVVKQAEALNDTTLHPKDFFAQPKPLYQDVTDSLPIDYRHQENAYYDFYRESLIPFEVSTEGPKIAVADVNGDGLDDFFVGGAKWQPGKLFLQETNGRFKVSNTSLWKADSVFEDVDALFFDANGDHYPDLYVVSGGNEFYGKMAEQFDRLYLNDGKGNFTKSQHLPPMYTNKSCVKAADFDQDGDLDLFVGGRVIGFQYGKTPDSYLLVNDGNGNFTDLTDNIAPGLRKAGMTTDAQWLDYDADGDIDLLVVGDWMPVRVYENQNNKLAEVTEAAGLKHTNGFWQTIEPADFDHDGDLDLLIGNLGTNTKLRKKEYTQLRLYVKDIDNNKTLDHILAYNLGEKWYPVATKDELGKQLPLINKKFTTYEDFAGKPIDELFTSDELNEADVLEINMFESIYLENLGNKKFKIHMLPIAAQVSKIFAFRIQDVNNDHNLDVLLGGNFYGASTYQGRYDGSYGLMLQGDGKGGFKPISPTNCGFLLEGEIRDIKSIQTAHGEMLLVARNGLPIQVFRKINEETLP